MSSLCTNSTENEQLMKALTGKGCRGDSKDSTSPPSSFYGSSIVGPVTQDRLRAKFAKELDPIKSSNHGSFYLRTGAVVFGVGSMIYSGLEFGQFFDMPDDPICGNIMAAVTPVARMIFTFIQMYFVFLNAKMQKVKSNVALVRFGLMHMVATNLCVWLNVIIQETKHEILYFDHDLSAKQKLRENSHTQHPILGNLSNDEGHNGTEKLLHRVTRGSLIDECRRMDLMGELTQNASPFLFPCAIEYSLICAAIMYTIWRHAGYGNDCPDSADSHSGISTSSRRSPHHYSVDCTNANKGLFFGIFVLVITIISMILFFVLINREDYKSLAITEVFLAELVLYSLTLIAVIIGMIEVNQLRFDITHSLDLDNVLLIVALTGAITYNVFTIIGTQFGTSLNTLLVLVNALTAIIQGVVQTIFILDASKRHLYTKRQQQHKPGREIITFLLVTNFAMWAVITLEKSRFDAHPVQSNFFGKWPWAIITNVSTPLAIFYRYHSTVCLCEIWKRCYKINVLHQNSRSPATLRSNSSSFTN